MVCYKLSYIFIRFDGKFVDAVSFESFYADTYGLLVEHVEHINHMKNVFFL